MCMFVICLHTHTQHISTVQYSTYSCAERGEHLLIAEKLAKHSSALEGTINVHIPPSHEYEHEHSQWVSVSEYLHASEVRHKEKE